MKKFISLILVLVMGMTLCACGSSAPNEEEEKAAIKDEIHTVIMAEANVHCMFNYADVKMVTVSITTTDDNGDGTYDVKGYATVLDDYGDKYKGKFDAVVSIDQNGEGDCESFKLETPKKQ